MEFRAHFPISSILGIGAGFYFQSWWIGIFCWLSGWLIDADHVLDYGLYLIKFKKSLPSFSQFLDEFFDHQGSYHKLLGRAFILAHGWEYELILIGLGAFKVVPWPWIIGVGLSYGLHLVLDSLENKPTTIFTYCLGYRLAKGFKANKLFKPCC